MSFSTVPLNAAAGLDRRVVDVMHAGHLTIPGVLPLAEAARRMAEQHVHAILVLDPQGGPLGWVTTRGMLHNLPRDWHGASATDAITEAVIAVAPDATIAKALEAFLASGASHVLVRAAGDGQVIGVVADSDLLSVLAGHPPAMDDADRRR